MFDQLVESRPTRNRSIGQAALSIVVHTAIIAASIRLTQAVAATVATVTHESQLFVLHVPPKNAAASAPATAPAAAPAVAPTPVSVPLNIPTSIPSVDLRQRYDASRFGRDSGVRAPSADLPGDTRLHLDAELTVLQVDEPAQYLDGPEPKFPSALRHAGIEGQVWLRFVVGTDGKPESGSIVVAKSTNASFESAAIATIEQSRYRAARVHGRAVRQIVEQQVRFALH